MPTSNDIKGSILTVEVYPGEVHDAQKRTEIMERLAKESHLNKNDISKQLVDYLNELLELDRPGISSLIESGVMVNELIAYNSKAICKELKGYTPGDKGIVEVSYDGLGVLGLINGFLFGHLGCDKICAHYKNANTKLIDKFGLVSDLKIKQNDDYQTVKRIDGNGQNNRRR